MEAIIEAFLDQYYSDTGASRHTLEAYGRDLKQWTGWLEQHGRDLAADETLVLQWMVALGQQGISPRSVARKLSALRQFYRFLLRTGQVQQNPVRRIETPKSGRKLPKTLGEGQVERLLQAPDVGDALGLRDRAMLELMYATGLRVSELVNLPLQAVHLQEGYLRVLGKGGKERLLPFGEHSAAWLENYLRESRPLLAGASRDPHLFLSRRGAAMTRQNFWQRLRAYARTAGIEGQLSPHTLRHAFATHLLSRGADLRVLQMLLGHSDLSTTEIYTALADQQLKALHARHHPRG